MSHNWVSNHLFCRSGSIIAFYLPRRIYNSKAPVYFNASSAVAHPRKFSLSLFPISFHYVHPRWIIDRFYKIGTKFDLSTDSKASGATIHISRAKLVGRDIYAQVVVAVVDNVFGADALVRQGQQLIIKFFDHRYAPSIRHLYNKSSQQVCEELFETEEKAYDRLKALQGQEIPLYFGFYSWFDPSGYRVPALLIEEILGEPLGELNAEKYTPSQREAIVASVLDGLGKIHSLNVAHRDTLILNNFILCKNGKVKLIDFGIAKIGQVENDIKNYKRSDIKRAMDSLTNTGWSPWYGDDSRWGKEGEVRYSESSFYSWSRCADFFCSQCI